MIRRWAGWVPLGCFVVGCASSGPPAETDRVETARGLPLSPGPIGPKELDRILQASERRYRVIEEPGLAEQPIADVLGLPARDPRPIDPFLVRAEDTGLASRAPPPASRRTFEQAGAAFRAGDLELSAALYLQAAKESPGYFKAHTYAGRVLFLQARLTEARQALGTAIRLNPLDYQAHLFLGEVLHEQGELVLAKEALTRAFVLHRGNPVVLERLEDVLEDLDLRLAGDVMQVPLQIRDGPERVSIAVGERTWAPMGVCLACWNHEPRCRDRSPADRDPLRLEMYRECLIHEAAALAVKRDRQGLRPSQARLLSAIEAGFLEAIIFWEVLVPRVPMVVFVAPESLREKIAEYVDRFLYVSTRVI